MVSFADVLQRLEAMGLTDVLLPFILIFAVVYAILNFVKIFGQEGKGKNINVIIALVMALLVVVPHVTGGYPPGKDIVEIMNNAIPNVSILIIGVLMFLILIGIFGVRFDLTGSGWFGPLIGMICMGAVFFIFGRSAGWFGFGNLPPFLGFLNDSETVSVLLVILMFIGIVAFITGDGGGGTRRLSSGIRNVFEEFGRMMGRP